MRAGAVLGRIGFVISALLFGLTPAPAWAEAFEGVGRVSIGPGWRLTPNDYFYGRAREAGHEPAGSSPGGPQLTGSFGYSATENLEVGIDLLLGYESLRVDGVEPISSFSYGALVGVRAQATNFPASGWVPYLGVGLGPMLVNVSSKSFGAHEQLVTGYAATAGVSVKLTESYGLNVDYRLLLARGLVPEIGGVNGGGSWFTVGLTVYFPREVRALP